MTYLKSTIRIVISVKKKGLGVGTTFSTVSIAAGATLEAFSKLRQYNTINNKNGITLKRK